MSDLEFANFNNPCATLDCPYEASSEDSYCNKCRLKITKEFNDSRTFQCQGAGCKNRISVNGHIIGLESRLCKDCVEAYRCRECQKVAEVNEDQLCESCYYAQLASAQPAQLTPAPTPATPTLPTPKVLAGEAWELSNKAGLYGFDLEGLRKLIAGKPWSEEDKSRMLAETIKAFPAFTQPMEDEDEAEEAEAEGKEAKAEEAEAEPISPEPVEGADLLPIPNLPGYQVDKRCRPWGTAKKGRAAGPLTPAVYFRFKKVKGKVVKWFICRYKVTVDGVRQGFTAKYFQQARFFAEQRRKGKQIGPDVDSYKE